MKTFYLLPLLGLLACSSQKSANTPAPDAKPHFADCGHLYNHILNLKVDTIQQRFCTTFNDEERKVAVNLLAQEYEETNTATRFYLYCYQHMTVKQVQCGMSTSKVEDIDSCKIF